MKTESSPFFTIITATSNVEEFLPQLLASLAEQTCQDFVWVCQDAQSSDATLAVVEEWRSRLPAVSLASEADTGIYDAWNKALERQGENLGQWVLFLGADDMLAGPDVLARVKERCMSFPPEVVLAAGDLETFSKNNIKQYISVDAQKSFRELAFGMLPHSSLLTHKKLFQFQIFDTQFFIAGDYDWLRRVWQKEEQLRSFGFLVTQMRLGGISSSNMSYSQLRREKRQIIFRYIYIFPKKIPQALIYCLNLICYPLKIRIKVCLEKYSWGKSLWNALQTFKKTLLK